MKTGHQLVQDLNSLLTNMHDFVANISRNPQQGTHQQ